MSLTFLFVLVSSGQFEGRVLDALTREPVPFARVEILNLGAEVYTDSAGGFQFGGIASGDSFDVAVSRVGYAPRVWTGVTPRPGRVFYLFPQAIPIAGVTSTASRVLPRASFSAPVSTVENLPARAHGRIDVGGLFEQMPGVQVHNYGNLTTLGLRGANAEGTLVLLDGVPLNSSLNNLADLSLLPVLFVRRVEVVRGGASALYGANPLGGVVNIQCPEPEEKKAEFGLGLGSFGMRYGNLLLSLPGPVSFLFGAGVVSADNRYPYRDALDSVRLRTNADLRRADLLAKIASGFSERHRLSFSGAIDFARRGSPGPLSFPSESARLSDSRVLAVVGYDLEEGARGRLSARFFHQRYQEEYHNPDVYFTANDTHQLYRSGFNLNQWFGLSDWLNTSLGFESGWEGAKSTTVGNPARKNGALYLEFGISGHGFTLKPALRYDLLIDTGGGGKRTYGAFSPRISLGFEVLKWLNIYAGFDRSFRAPTFNERWWPNDGWSQGNPNLQPENGIGFDLGLGFQPGPGRGVRLNLYRSNFDNLIQWQPDTNWFYQPKNIASAKMSGAEFQGEISGRWFGVSGSFTYERAYAEVKVLPYRPRIYGGIGMSLGYPVHDSRAGIKLCLDAKGTSFRLTDPENTDTLPGYFIVNAELTVKPCALFRIKTRPEFSTVFGCRNLFDKHYQDIKDYPLPGRNVYFEIDMGL